MTEDRRKRNLHASRPEKIAEHSYFKIGTPLVLANKREDALLVAIAAETDEQSLLDLDITTGWPANPDLFPEE